MIDVGPVLRQGAPDCRDVVLGDGPRTIGQAGCLLACLAMVSHAMRGTRRTLVEVNAEVWRDGGFLHSGLLVDAAARTLGLHVSARGSFGVEALKAELGLGRPVVLGIDYRAGHSSGLTTADHFVVAVGIDGPLSVRVANPASGLVEALFLDRTLYRGHVAHLVEMLTFQGAE